MAVMSVTIIMIAAGLAQANGTDTPPGELTVEELIRRKDPSGDDWTSEKLHEHAKHQLKELGKVLADADGRSNLDLPLFFVPDCSVSDLRPIESATSRSFGKLKIWDARSLPASMADKGDVRAALADLMAPYGSIGGQRFAFKTLRIVVDETAGTLRTTMFYQCYGPSSDGVVEQHALWEIDWLIAEDPQRPRIARVRVSEFSESSAMAS